MQINNIPEELKVDGVWCNWKLTNKGKVPFNSLTGKNARSNDKSTFTTFKNAMSALAKYYNVNEQGQVTGGLGLGIFNGFSAIDIDNCVDDNGVVSDLASDIIDYCASYTEYSPSGTGIRIIFKTNTTLDKAKYYINNSKIGLEIYLSDNTHKFVTITGDALYSNSISDVDISYILEKYMKKDQASVKKLSNKDTDFDIDKINDKKLHELWDKKAPGSNADESESDLALCSKIAYYVDCDFYAVDKVFRSSPYYMSKDNEHLKKWEIRDDYRETTITKAINGVKEYKKKNRDFDLNDTGNARHFIDTFGDKIRYNIDNKNWMFWNDKFWQTDIFNHVKNLAELTIEDMKHRARTTSNEETRKAILKNAQRALQRSGKENMLKEAEHIEGVGITNFKFNQDSYLFNCESGVVDLRTGKIKAHNKDDYISKFSPHKISFETPKLWLKFLDEIFEKDQEVIRYVQKAMGYSMTASMREEVMFILLGDGSNGKSVLLETLNEALGDYGGTSNVDILLEKKYSSGENKGEIARLNGLRQVTTEEPGLGDKLNESAIKTMTSGAGKIVARFLYANEFEFSPKMKIWMAANYKPKIRGTDHGIWRRIRIIPFNITFEDEKQDKELKNKLKSEIEQILGWMIEGCKLWLKEGLKEPKKLQDAQHEYRSEMDVVQRWVDENCVLAPNAKEKSSKLFENFSHYAKSNKEFQLSHTMFGRNLSKKFKKKVVYGITEYLGIRIREGSILTKEERDEI